MAEPLHFIPKINHQIDLKRQLEAAPLDNAEAILVAYDILRSAHANGTLDLIDGIVNGRDVIAAKVAEYAKLPEGIAAIRNLLALSKLLTAVDPETLDRVTAAMTAAVAEHQTERTPPSLFTLLRRTFSTDTLRALSFLTHALNALGKALNPTTTTPKH
jgi:uncharacterized protein YjgD (DUF1641 family)